jgi:hypothetical protein
MADITLDDLTAGRGYEHWATQSQMQSLIEQTKDIPRIAGFFQALGSTSKKETDLSKAILQAARQNLQVNQAGNRADAKGRKEDQRANAMVGGKVNANISKLTQITSSFMRTDGRPGGMFGLMAKGYDMIANAVGGIGGNNDQVASSAQNLRQRFLNLGTVASGLSAGLGFIASSLQVMGGVVDDVTRLQERLSDRGFTLADDFMGISTAALQLGIGFNELEKVVERGRRNFAALGGGVADGTKVFLSMYDTVRAQMFDLGNLGFSSGQVIQGFQEFIDSQVTTGSKMDRLALNSDATATAFTNLLRETEAVAKLTGTRREELLRNRFSVINDNAFQAQVRAVRITQGDEAAENLIAAQGAMGNALGSFQNTALGKQIQSAMVQALPMVMRRGNDDGMFAYTGNAELQRNLNLAGGPELINQIQNIVETVARGGSVEDVMAGGTGLQAILNSDQFNLRVAELTSIPGALRQIGDGLAELGTAAERNRNFTMDNVVSAMDATTTAASGAADSVGRFNTGLGQTALALEAARGNLQAGFLDSSLSSLNNIFGGEQGNLRSIAESINNQQFRDNMYLMGQGAGALVGTGAGIGIAGTDALLTGINALSEAITGGETRRTSLADIKDEVRALATAMRNQPQQ